MGAGVITQTRPPDEQLSPSDTAPGAAGRAGYYGRLDFGALPSSDEMHQLDHVPIGEPGLGDVLPPHDVAVELHHDGAGIEAQAVEQIRHGGRRRHLPGLAVDGEGEDAHAASIHGARSASAAPAGSAASQSEEIAAAPQAPASRSSGARARSEEHTS